MKKFFKYFFLLLAFLAVVFAGLFLQAMFRFDVIIYPINRYIKEHSGTWGASVNLIPDIFSEHEDFEDVEKKLFRAGYTRIADGEIWGRYADRVGENKYAYIRDANMLVCNIELYIFLELDDNQKLKKANGTQEERGCL